MTQSSSQPPAVDPRIEPPVDDPRDREIARLRQRLAELEAGDHRLETSYRQLLDDIPCQIAVFDLELRYLYVNQASIRDPQLRRWILGKSDAEYCRHRGRDPAVAEQRDRYRRQALAEQRPISFEEEIETADGERRTYLRTHAPMIEGGKVKRLIGYGVDLSEQKLLAEQMRQSHKLEAIARLAGSVAHDFNNLLTAILGYGQLLQRHTENDPKLARYVGSILDAGERAGSLIRHLLAFSRRRQLRMVDLELDAVLRDLAEVLGATLGESIQLRWQLGAPRARAHLDPGGLRQALLELVINAREAMPTGGTVTLGSRISPAEDGSPGWLRLTVEDDGSGMDEATRQRVFEPFFTTKARHAGGGQGLASVYGFVRQSGGRVGLTSAPGAGARVVLDFPLIGVGHEDPPSTDRDRASGEGHGERILVVEDEEAVRELVCDMLSSLGYQVSTAVHGLEALRLIDNETFDLLLSDVVMPRMGGIELAQHLAERRPDLPVVLMSGYTGGSPQAANLDPSIPFLAKPFRPDDLSGLIRQVLDRATIGV